MPHSTSSDVAGEEYELERLRAHAIDAERDRLLDELVRRLVELGAPGPGWTAGLATVKLLLVDAGGERQLITLEPGSVWQAEPRADGGELFFLERIELVGVERPNPDAFDENR